jgi:hypothetical protein
MWFSIGAAANLVKERFAGRGKLLPELQTCEEMTEFVFFGAQVSSRMFTGARPARNALDDANASAFKLPDFVWVIGEQTHVANA